MAPITKLTKKPRTFFRTKECQKAWELIKHKYIEALILMSPNWEVEFHVHIDASLLAMGAMMFQNVIGKNDQLVVYASKLLNIGELNYNTIEREVLTVVFSLHKFRHYLLSNKFVFYVDHMALVYLVNKPHVSSIIIRRLLLFIEYDFILVYKLGITHVVAWTLSILPYRTKPTCVFDQTIMQICFTQSLNG
jgi:hypothetical protein